MPSGKFFPFALLFSSPRSCKSIPLAVWELRTLIGLTQILASTSGPAMLFHGVKRPWRKSPRTGKAAGKQAFLMLPLRGSSHQHSAWANSTVSACKTAV